MSCKTCYDLCELHKNATATLGAITDTDTLVYVYIESPSGRIESEQVTTDGSGNVALSLDLTYLSHGEYYRAWVTGTEYSATEKDITPTGLSTTYECVRFKVIDGV